MRPILAILALLCLNVFAEELPPVPPPGSADTAASPAPSSEADGIKAQANARIQEEAGNAVNLVNKTNACCAGDQSKCQRSKHLEDVLNKIKEQTNADTSGLGATGVAVAKGELTDTAKKTEDAFKGVCRQARSSCYDTINSLIDDIAQQCADCNFQPLKTQREACGVKGEPVHTQQAVMTGPANPNDRQQVVTKPGETPIPIVPAPAIPGGYPPAQTPGGGQPTANPTSPSPTQEHPVQVIGDNKDWRNSLGDDKEKPWVQAGEKQKDPTKNPDVADPENSEPRMRGEGKMTAFSDSLSKMAKGMQTSSFQAASTSSGGGGQPVAVQSNFAPVAPSAPAVSFPAMGSVGMREATPRAANRVYGAPTASAAQAPQGKPSFATAAVQQMGYAHFQAPAGAASPHTMNSSGVAPVNHGPNSAVGHNQFSQPNISPQAMGGGAMGSAQTQPAAAPKNLAAYLPKFSPQSRSIAGTSAGGNPQILSQGKDVWQNMSMRLQYFCKIGRLYDCK